MELCGVKHGMARFSLMYVWSWFQTFSVWGQLWKIWNGVSPSELQMSKETMILFQIYIIFWVTQHVEEYKSFSNQCLIVNNVLQGNVENWV